MTPTKYEFMQDMLTRANNRYRRKHGLPLEEPEEAPTTPEPVKAPDGQAGGFNGKLTTPIPLDSAFPENQHSTYAEDEPVGEG